MSVAAIAFLVAILQILNQTSDGLLIITACFLLYCFFKIFIKHVSYEIIDCCFVLASSFPICLAVIQFCKSVPIITGAYDSPVGLAFSVILTIISLCNLLTRRSTRKYLILYIVLIVICFIIICASHTRIGLLSAFVVIAIFFMKRYRRIMYLIFCGLFLFSIFNYKTESSKGRWFIYSTTLSMIDTPKHVFFGYGQNGFSKNYMLQQAIKLKGEPAEVQQRADNIRHPLNEFLLLLIYGGLFFLLLVLGLLVLLRNTTLDKAHLSFVCVLFIFSLFSYPFRYPITWVALAWYIATLNYKCSKSIYIYLNGP